MGGGHQVLERGRDFHFSLPLALEGRGAPWGGPFQPYLWAQVTLCRPLAFLWKAEQLLWVKVVCPELP